jgi:ubiquinone/menaquinone biosynthesis C-methylase UbiE
MVYINARAENIPLTDNFADFVIGAYVFDYVCPFSKSVDEIYRILKPMGSILLEINIKEKLGHCERTLLNKETIQKHFKNKFKYNMKLIQDKYFKIACVKGVKIN